MSEYKTDFTIWLDNGNECNNEYKTVKEISIIYKVTTQGVRYWLSKGLKYKIEKVVGIKPRKVIKILDVEEFLKLSK